MSEGAINFCISGILSNQFAIIEKAYAEGEEVQMGTGVSFGFNPQDRQVFALLKLSFEQKGSPFLLLEAGCVFEVEAAAWKQLFNPSDNSATLAKDFAIHLCLLTVGTARGLLYAKTEGTPFQQFILPTLNITEIITQDVVIKEEKDAEA